MRRRRGGAPRSAAHPIVARPLEPVAVLISVKMKTMSDVDWDALRQAAREAMGHAYVPYSHFPVGAAAITEDGRVVSGCNVENASYGVTLCAECSLVSQLAMTGGGLLTAFACVDGEGRTLMPCGRCRQLLVEHAAPGMLLDTVSGIRTIAQVLPDAFGPRELDEYAERTAR